MGAGASTGVTAATQSASPEEIRKVLAGLSEADRNKLRNALEGVDFFSGGIVVLHRAMLRAEEKAAIPQEPNQPKGDPSACPTSSSKVQARPRRFDTNRNVAMLGAPPLPGACRFIRPTT